MKAIRIISLLFIVASMSMSCSGQANQNEKVSVKKTDDVQVYYFHFERRCATCQAVEAESKKAVEELYGDKVIFSEVNLDTPEGEIKGKEIGVSGQTLLIVSGETKIDITNDGFMHARNNPEKLKKIIKDKIDPLIK